MKLSKLREGEVAVVVEIEGDSGIRRRLLEMGITKGVEVRVVRNAPLRDPIELEVRGYFLSQKG